MNQNSKSMLVFRDIGGEGKDSLLLSLLIREIILVAFYAAVWLVLFWAIHFDKSTKPKSWNSRGTEDNLVTCQKALNTYLK